MTAKPIVYEDNDEETNEFWEKVLGSRNASRERMEEVVYQGIVYHGYTTGRVRGGYVGGPWSLLRAKPLVHEDDDEETKRFGRGSLGSETLLENVWGELCSRESCT